MQAEVKSRRKRGEEEEKREESKPEAKPVQAQGEGEGGVRYVDWRDVIYTGPNLLFGPPLSGKSRFAWAIMNQLLGEGKKVLYIATEPNLVPILDQLRKVLSDAVIEYFENPFQVREYAKLLYLRRKWVKYDFVVVDSLAGVREDYSFMYGSGKLRDTFEANRLTTEITWGLARYAYYNKIPVLIITHETPGINRTCFGKQACPTSSIHAMYTVSSVMYMYKQEKRDEEGNVVSIERVIEVVDHRYKPELIGYRVKLLEPPL